VIRIEPDRRRIGLSARKVGREEWEQWYAEAATRAAAQEQARREAEAQAAPESESAESPLAEDEVFDEETLGSDILLGDETSEDFVGDVAETPAA